MTCPSCGCERFRFQLPGGQRLIGPICEKTEMIINLLADPAFKEPADPCLDMTFTCAQFGWRFIKPEGEPLHSAFSRAHEETLRP